MWHLFITVFRMQSYLFITVFCIQCHFITAFCMQNVYQGLPVAFRAAGRAATGGGGIAAFCSSAE